MLTADRLRELLDYDPATGVFTWRVYRSRGARIGGTAGTIHKRSGYVAIGIDGTVYYAQRLAWLFIIGSWPPYEIDHENRIRSDNSWDNLRCATSSDNKCNRPGRGQYPKGVTFHRQSGLYHAAAYKHGHRFSLGYHGTPEDAHAAYVRVAESLHGEFARTI